MITREQERLAKNVLHCAHEVHSFLGPGLLESTYQTCVQYELTKGANGCLSRGVISDLEMIMTEILIISDWHGMQILERRNLQIKLSER
jgi:hypothetical protein